MSAEQPPTGAEQRKITSSIEQREGRKQSVKQLVAGDRQGCQQRLPECVGGDILPAVRTGGNPSRLGGDQAGNVGEPGQQTNGPAVCTAHSRTSSSSSGDGVLLSVSALTGGRAPPKQTTTDLCCSYAGGAGCDVNSNCERMRTEVEEEEVMEDRPEPEGLNETDGPTGFSSFLSVDKRLFGRLQDELTAAQSELRLKEEEVTRLSRIRDDIESELEELTASLFQEAHKMVADANIKRIQAEKRLAESEMKVDGLQTEVTALKAMVITSTPARPNKHLYPQLEGRGAISPAASAPGSPAKERLGGGGGEDEGTEAQEARYIDPILRQEYLQWKKSPSMESTSVFLARIYREDILPCLDFPNTDLSAAVQEGVHTNSICISPVKDDEELPRNCTLFQQPRRCTHRLRLGEAAEETHYISPLARNRIAAVCDFLSYCRYVTQGLVKSHCNDVYWEIMGRRRSMTLARLGFVP